MMINEVEQGRASFAYQSIINACNNKDDFKKKYKSYVKRLPMLIKTNGLGQALAFVKSKSANDNSSASGAYALIYKQVAQWLREDQKHLMDINPDDDLVQKIVELDIERYRYVTGEVMALLNWMKRFADGLIEGEDE